MSARRLLVGAAGVGVVVLSLVLLFWWRGSRAPVAPVTSAPVTLPSATDDAPPPAPVDRTPEIRGRVLDADGNAAVDATVRLVSASPPYSVYREVKSGAGGLFSFANLGPWSTRVVADRGADGVVTSAVVSAAPGATVELTLVLSAASAVRGTVVDASDHPVEGAVVSIEGVPWTVSAVSDHAGAFLLVTVPDEATSLVAVARGFRTAHARLGNPTADHQGDRGDPGERVVRVVLDAASPIDGEVRDDQGNPINAEVVACEDQPSETRAQSAADGTFQLAPSAIGCDAVAEHEGLAASAPVSVVDGKHLVLQLKTGGVIEGVVVDERGSGVSPVTLGIESFVPLRGRMRPGNRTRNLDDLRGAFRWEKLAPGTYVLTASTPGRPPVRSASIDVRAGAVSGGIRIALLPGGTLVGHVLGPDGPVAGANLHFDSVSSVVESKAAAVSDDTGAYRLEEAPEGAFTMRVDKEGLLTKFVSGLHVAPGATVVANVTLSARDGGTGWELGGIGAQLAQTPAGMVVQKAFPGDPAATAGLRQGDRIVRIDGEPIEGMSNADVLGRIRGEPGTTVGIAAQRPETGQMLEVVIVRARVVH